MDLDGLTTAHVADGCLRVGVPVRCGPAGMRPIAEGTAFAGPAAPALHLGSVDRLLEAIDAAAPGDVLVVDNAGRLDEACLGDLLVLEAAGAGLAGVVVWGLHRDTGDLRRIGLPLLSVGALPTGPLPHHEREQRDDVRVGEWPVAAGDLVVADDDGVVLVDAASAEAVLAAARGIRDAERAQAERIAGGASLRGQLRFADYLARRETDPSWTFRRHLREVGGEIEV
ncbi:RraA family protein [Amnibacterium setariae]|uniref:Putative 4-hydroxy-4-methyl-2-oxoglutarate aldolase n=1 Tax=Amnibacterium setariae TaxID=2306585 RepID=A0A3A1TW08_9MICO|nr:RraA family protein [Amnibacterium setariae]RIX27731.1 RraA family protein [Amnibacterium setariae]